jgi:hypothetical protein
MWDDLFVREITNGIWFLMNVSILIAIGCFLFCQFGKFGLGSLWARLRDETSTGDQVAVALFVYFIGSSIRAGWVWTVLLLQSLGRDTDGFDQASDWLLTAVAIGIVGTFCCMRIFSRDQWGHKIWVGFATFAILTPFIAHYIFRLL